MPRFVGTEPAKSGKGRLLGENFIEEVADLKQQEGKDILVFGSAQLVNVLHKQGLVDEYRLMMFPITVGSGKRLFENEGEQKNLKFVSTETFSSGVVVLTYQPE